ncbi:MAG: hypothetical protein IPL33_11445 [Sphingobacteriales bacterium]|nr:hypothetical protein [Sphingobacteriales bacterium]
MKARAKSQKNSYLGNCLPILTFSILGLSQMPTAESHFLCDSAAFLLIFSQTIARNYSAIPRFYGTVPTENFGEIVLGCFLVKRR